MTEADTKNLLVFPRGRRHAWVAEGLRRDIMLGDIEPGEILLELEVAARFHCSQSTVREALLLLQEEGLVQRSHHRGTRVSVLTEDEALEMLRLRRDMECPEAQLPNVEPLLLRCLIHNHRYKLLNSRDRHDLHHTAQRHVVIIEAVEHRDTAGLVAALEHHASTIFDKGPPLL